MDEVKPVYVLDAYALLRLAQVTSDPEFEVLGDDLRRESV